jgi:hypothetical protein
MTQASGNPELEVRLGKSTFVVRQDGSELRVGTRTGDAVLWQDETVPLDTFPGPARAALDAGDTSSSSLQLALQGIVDAFAQRGG